MTAIDLVLWHDRYRFRADRDGRLPTFAGSAWRGAFGHALKRTVCVMRLRPCCGCPLERSCIYPTVFEAAPDPEGQRLSSLERIAQPYVLMPPWAGPRQIAAGEEVSLGVTLVGRAAGQRAYVRRALEAAAAAGLGRERVPLTVTAAEPSSAAAPLPEGVPLRLVLRTPVRLKRDGRLVTPASLAAGDLLMALVRRVSMLRAFHDEAPLALDFAGLKQAAAHAAFTSRAVRWVDTLRYSTRQERHLQMGGLVGSVVLEAGALRPFLPFLTLAPWIGVGKGASMGLGQVDVVAA